MASVVDSARAGLAGLVAGSLVKLTDLQREVITLAYFGGHTHRQVAAILGAPLGTVKGRIREALIRLRLAMTSDD